MWSAMLRAPCSSSASANTSSSSAESSRFNRGAPACGWIDSFDMAIHFITVLLGHRWFHSGQDKIGREKAGAPLLGPCKVNDWLLSFGTLPQSWIEKNGLD